MSGNVVHVTAEQLNANDESITIVEVHCKHGAFVGKGTHLMTIETSKAAAEIYSPADGYVALAGAVGTVIDVGKNIATIYPTHDALRAEAALAANEAEKTHKSEDSGDSPRATRKAIELARELGVNIGDIQKVGFIREDDVRQYFAEINKVSGRDRLELSRVRKAAVKSLEISRNTIIPACLLAEFRFRNRAGKKVDVFDLVVHRASRLIAERYPDCNAHFEGGAIVRSPRVDFGFMVDVDGDIFMPVIRDAGSLSLEDIAATRAEIILALFRGDHTQDMLAKPTVCASGLNGSHLTFQLPVVYPTTSLIIGVNQKIGAGAQEIPVFMTFVYDHRVLSGLIVSRFVDDLIDAVLGGP